MIHDLRASNILIPRTQRRDSSISDKGILDRHCPKWDFDLCAPKRPTPDHIQAS